MALLYFHTSRVRLKRKYLLRSRKKELLFCIQQTLTCVVQYNEMAESKITIEISGYVTVFEDFNNFVDINGSIYR